MTVMVMMILFVYVEYGNNDNDDGEGDGDGDEYVGSRKLRGRLTIWRECLTVLPCQTHRHIINDQHSKPGWSLQSHSSGGGHKKGRK